MYKTHFQPAPALDKTVYTALVLVASGWMLWLASAPLPSAQPPAQTHTPPLSAESLELLASGPLTFEPEP